MKKSLLGAKSHIFHINLIEDSTTKYFSANVLIYFESRVGVETQG